MSEIMVNIGLIAVIIVLYLARYRRKLNAADMAIAQARCTISKIEKYIANAKECIEQCNRNVIAMRSLSYHGDKLKQCRLELGNVDVGSAARYFPNAADAIEDRTLQLAIEIDDMLLSLGLLQKCTI